VDEETGNPLEHCHHIKMEKYRDVHITSFANKLGRLAQDIRDMKGTYTKFICKTQVPNGRKITYGRQVYDYCPQIEEQNSARLAI